MKTGEVYNETNPNPIQPNINNNNFNTIKPSEYNWQDMRWKAALLNNLSYYYPN